MGVYADLMTANEEFSKSNSYLFINENATEEDQKPETVKEPKIWKKFGQLYKCGNCGYIPTFVDIRDWARCPKCDILKFFYETDDGLKPMYEHTKEVEDSSDRQDPVVS